MIESALLATWRAHIASSSPGLHLADAVHPLQIYIGKTDQGAARMVIRSSQKTSKPALASIVLVERYEDQSGRWNLSLTLQDPKFTEVFLRLVDDVHDRSKGSPNENVALDRVNVVFEEWRRLLTPRSSGLLTMDELRGLIGELWLLLNVFSNERPIATAIEGWLGPLGLPQDFWYPEDGYYEAKSVGPSATRIRVSSENQLDADILQLLVLSIGNASEQSAGAINLPMLVNRTLAGLSDESASADPLTERLQRLGVELSETYYHDTWFVVTHLTSYIVGPDFPAIRATRLIGGITRVVYQIDLASIERFKRSSVSVG